MRRYTLSVLLVALLAACGTPGQSTPSPLNEQASATRVAQEAKQEGVVVVYQRSGGLAGVSEQWLIYADGRVVNDKGRTARVTTEQVATLLADLQALKFFDLSGPYGLPGKCKDCFTYQITVNSEGQIKSVTAIEGMAETPASFWQAVDRINSLLNKVSQ